MDNNRIIPWQNVEWKDSIDERFDIDEIKQVLLTRQATKDELNGNKKDLIKHLKDKYTVNLEVPIESLTLKELKNELKLIEYQDTKRFELKESAEKSTLTECLKNEISERQLRRPWINLKQNIPKIHFSQPIMLNEDQFFIATKQNGFYKYTVSKNEWCKWLEYPTNIVHNNHVTCMCLDSVSKIIYLYRAGQNNGELLAINYETNEWKTIAKSLRVYYFPKLLFINNQIHLFASSCKWAGAYDYHCVFNDNALRFFKLNQFSVPGLVSYVPSENIILQISISDWSGISCESYDINKGQWSIVQNDEISFESMSDCTSELSNKLISGLISTGKYIIFEETHEEFITVLDVTNMKVIETNVTWPSSEFPLYRGIVVNDTLNSELIVYGYVRRMGKDIFPSEYFLEFMRSWYQPQYFHIVASFPDEHDACSDDEDPHVNQPKHLKLCIDEIKEQMI